MSTEKQFLPESEAPARERVSPEQLPTVEKSRPAEQQRPTSEQAVDTTSLIQRMKWSLLGGRSDQPITLTPAEQPLLKEVESILEEDLGEVYHKMSPAAQAAFRQSGEETASRIIVLLRTVRHHTTRVYRLIAHWLKQIPGVNRFFLVQEAKLKTDKIIELEQERRDIDD